RPATTVPRATRVCPGGPGPDEAGPAAVARPVPDPHTGEWHTVATYPGLDHAEHLLLGPDGQVPHAEAFALAGAPLLPPVAARAPRRSGPWWGWPCRSRTGGRPRCSARASPTPGRPGGRPGWACWPTGPTGRGGSTSGPATCSTRSTPTTTATG